MGLSLAEIFQTDDHRYGDIHDYVEHALRGMDDQPALLFNKGRGGMAQIDLGGRHFILDRPLLLSGLNLVTLTNGTLIAGPSFPEDEFLIRVSDCHGVQLRNLFIECSKRANGVHLESFLRIRIEDCYMVHQRKFGIYSSPTGGNHELEIIKCHITEFVFGDGYPKKKVNYGVIPEFDVDENRQSTGIFLGQADNVVADCNINLCRTGIFSGMRANRIQGNHITGGGSKRLELFKGIELNNFHKSSALIVNNYIDNCCLWINCDANPKANLRNYFHVTDNLFYRGYNHPVDGGEFNHIVINPLEPDSLIGNLHICDNKFYNQPENLDGIKPRVIVPLRINGSDPAPGSDPEKAPTLDHRGLLGVSMKDNYFTNCFPTFVVPMGTCVTKMGDFSPEKRTYRVSFEKEIPLGVIQNASVSVLEYAGEGIPVAAVRRIAARTVQVEISASGSGRFSVTASAEAPYGNRYNYIVN